VRLAAALQLRGAPPGRSRLPVVARIDVCFPLVRAPSAARDSIGQSMVALSRTVGPAVGSLVLAWSLTSGLPFPLDESAAFCLSGVIYLLPLRLSFMMGSDFRLGG
jgi:hypothetical protein